ncbi:MAG: GTP cyclohydrolase II [Bacteroidota bacterium]
MISYSKSRDTHFLEKQSEALIPTDWGTFNMMAYSYQSSERMPHITLVREGTDFSKPVLVRIHSECLTGDLFSSNRCECGEQLQTSMEKIGAEGGVLIYLRQEGRGIGIINKLHAYQKQDQGYDTIAANEVLGFESDARTYEVALKVLNDLEVKEIKLLTNNPLKVSAFDESGIRVIERVPLLISPKKENLGYLRTKKNSMGHFLDVY